VCHQVKHIGRSIAIGKEKQCHTQLRKVNKWTQEQVNEHIQKSFEVYKERSQHEWELDISILEDEPYGIKLKPFTKRKFKVKKYKKKKRKKTAAKKLAVKKVIKRRPKRTKK
jgi:hypothetical protein